MDFPPVPLKFVKSPPYCSDFVCVHVHVHFCLFDVGVNRESKGDVSYQNELMNKRMHQMQMILVYLLLKTRQHIMPTVQSS